MDYTICDRIGYECRYGVLLTGPLLSEEKNFLISLGFHLYEVESVNEDYKFAIIKKKANTAYYAGTIVSMQPINLQAYGKSCYAKAIGDLGFEVFAGKDGFTLNNHITINKYVEKSKAKLFERCSSCDYVSELNGEKFCKNHNHYCACVLQEYSSLYDDCKKRTEIPFYYCGCL